MATVKVRLDGGDQVVTASITKDAAVDLGLAEGQPATVLIKSTEVAISMGRAAGAAKASLIRRECGYDAEVSMIRVRDAADLLGVSDDTVRRWD